MNASISMILIAVGFIAMAVWQIDSKVTHTEVRVTKAERTLVMLHTCFPHGHYKADAAPTCPAFEKFVTSEADKNETAFKGEPTDAN